MVAITDEATYYNGKKIPSWVKAQNWYVKSDPDEDYVIIDENEAGTNFICSPIYKKFLTIVAKDNISEQTKKEETNLCPYHVRSAVDCLYIRKGAGINTAKVGKITDKGVYTIVEEKNGTGASKWGKLKSGIGWISLDCANKV